MNDNQSPDPEHGLPYPSRGSLQRLYYKMPLLLWRMGLKGYFSHPSRGGSRMLVLTTRGRKSGLPRHTMVSAVGIGGQDYILSGWGLQSQWVRNIREDPLVTVQVYRRTYPAQVRRVSEQEEFSRVAEEMFKSGGDSHFKPWLDSLGMEDSVESMVAHRDQLTMFALDPVDQIGPAALPMDLIWVFPILLAVLVVIIVLLVR